MQLCISPGIRPSCIKGPRSKEGTNGLLNRGRLRARRVNHTAQLQRNRIFQSSKPLMVACMFSGAIY